MKLLIASDIHGSAAWCAKLVQAVEAENPDAIVLLGDLLYHGPRNALPSEYNPQRVAEMLNGLASRIIACRGNCEAEVDQMMLSFPCLADYTILFDACNGLEPRQLFATHGHIFGPGLDQAVDALPSLPSGSALLYGHTHVKRHEQLGEIEIFNPGSVSIPKDGTHSYGLYENGRFSHVVLE